MSMVGRQSEGNGAADARPAAPAAPQWETLEDVGELAIRLKQDLGANRDLVVMLDGREFLLQPSRGLFLSAAPLNCVEDCMAGAEVRIGTAETRQIDAVPRRLVDLLWHLGFHAGAGKLLPWLNNVAPYQLSRWPEGRGSFQYMRLSAELRETALAPLAIAQQTGMSLPDIYNFLNACSMVGCLRIAEATQAASPAAAWNIVDSLPPEARALAVAEPAPTRTLLSRIRALRLRVKLHPRFGSPVLRSRPADLPGPRDPRQV